MQIDSPAPSRIGALFRNVALYAAGFAGVIVWLPFVRTAMDGDSYQWGAAWFGRQFSGAGFGGDYWLLPAQAALALASLYLGFRKAGAAAYWLLCGWLAVNAASWGLGQLTAPGTMIFRGDTLGVEMDIGAAATAFFAGALVFALLGARLEHGGGRKPPTFSWKRLNTVLASLALLLAVPQFMLLRDGEPHGASDEAGVILTMAQWAIIVFAFALGRRRN